MLVGRDDVGRRGVSGLPALGLPLGLQVGVAQDPLPVPRGDVHRGDRGHLLLLHNVAEAPPAALPRVRVPDLLAVVRKTAVGTPLQLVRLEVGGRGVAPGPGRLGEHARHVVEGRDPVPPEVPPPRVNGPVDDPLDALLLGRVGHVGAEPVHLAPHQRVGVGPNWLRVGRHVEPRAVVAHLVVVDVGLRHPLPKQNLADVPRLDCVLHVGVAVVVVADVVVIEPRHRDALVVGALRPPVPVGDHLRPVGVQAREDDRDGILPDAVVLVVLAADELVDDLGGGLRGRHLVGVEAVGLRHHRLSLVNGLLDLSL